MRSRITVLVALAVMLALSVVPPVSAEDIPTDTLAAMGLGSMERISDDQGMEVRGEGFASVFGIGFASVLLASRLDNHSATSSVFNANASGDSQSTVSTSVAFTFLGQSISVSLNASAVGQGFAYGR